MKIGQKIPKVSEGIRKKITATISPDVGWHREGQYTKKLVCTAKCTSRDIENTFTVFTQI